MANLITNVNQACADLANIKKAIIDNGVEVANGTPSSEYANKVKDVYDAGVNSFDETISQINDGIEEALYSVSEGGKSYYDEFWDGYQDNGTRTQYPYAFYVWGDVCFKPKYPIIFGTNVSSQDTFSYAGITEVPVDIIVQEGFNIHSAFYSCSELKTIKKIIITENSTIDNHCFDGCRNLSDIRFEGVIGQSINFQWSPLSKESIESIFDALSTTSSGKTLTLNANAVHNAFTDAEWSALISTKSNWTISLV